ncbi:MAG: ATP-binding protein, partial [Bacteroidetes bacterium]
MARPENPFPGRTYLQEEAPFFFGRERQVRELKHHISSRRLVALTGAPNVGKTSLLRAGLIPQLEQAGYQGMAGPHWKIVRFDPGTRPLDQLIQAVARRNILLPDQKPDPAFERELGRRFRSRPRGLVEAYQSAVHMSGYNFLLIIDQFEVFLQRDWDEEGAQFIRLLLSAIHDPDLPIYMVLGLRSGALAGCASYEGLADPVMRGAYPLYPLTHEDLDRALRLPIERQGGSLQPRLRDQLIELLDHHPDQLMTLQAIMVRAWTAWEKAGGKGPIGPEHFAGWQEAAEPSTRKEPERKPRIHIERERSDTPVPPTTEEPGSERPVISSPESQKEPSVPGSGPAHAAEQLYASLPEAQQALTARLFKGLVWNNRFTNQKPQAMPVIVDTLAASMGRPVAEVLSVATVWREARLIRPLPPDPLESVSLLELHATDLIDAWDRLADWMKEEAADLEQYLRLVEGASQNQALLTGPELDRALSWRDTFRPTEEWARPYDPK